MDEPARRDLVLTSYEHLAMLAVEVAFTNRLLTADSWMDHVEFGDVGPGIRRLAAERPLVFICGHGGNWEVLGYSMALIGFPFHALYRPLDLKPLDTWVKQTRGRAGMVLVDKFGAMHDMPRIVKAGGHLGFVADQNAGDRGVFVPFFGRLASTYKSIALLVMQFGATVVCGQATRLDEHDPNPATRPGAVGEGFSVLRPGPFRYRVQLGDYFEREAWADQPDPLFYICARFRRSLELMVRQAPEQYLWMHRVWKSRPRHEKDGKPMPESMVAKLRALPWLGEDGAAAVVEQSARDAEFLRRMGTDRLV
jgi:KDO2-lipid IV(A) lauroyltransferase